MIKTIWLQAERYATDAITTSIQKSYGESLQTAVTKAVDNIQTNVKILVFHIPVV